jgi:transposase, IS5 family
VIQARRLQRSFGDGLIAAEVKDLRDAWMPHVDAILADDEIIAAVHQALAQRHPNSCRRGRPGFSAEVVVRLLVLKHLRNWSYQVLEREVRANLVYRDFTRVGSEKVPDAKTMGRWGTALGPAAIQQIHGRIVQIAQAQKIVQGRRMRVDTTVVESNRKCGAPHLRFNAEDIVMRTSGLWRSAIPCLRSRDSPHNGRAAHQRSN